LIAPSGPSLEKTVCPGRNPSQKSSPKSTTRHSASRQNCRAPEDDLGVRLPSAVFVPTRTVEELIPGAVFAPMSLAILDLGPPRQLWSPQASPSGRCPLSF